MKSRLYFLVFFFLLLPLFSPLFASSTGRTGATFAPSCGECHGSANAATFVTITSSSGTFTVAPGGTLTLTMVVAHSGKAAAGMNVGVTDLGGVNAGTLGFSGGSGLRTSIGELTHSTPKIFSGTSATFTFTWTAPSTPGTYFLNGAGNAVDNTGGSDNDAFNFIQGGPILLNVTGQISTPILLLPTNATVNISTTSSLSWTSLSGAQFYEYQMSTSSTFASIVRSGAVSSPSVTPTTLDWGTQYYWRVRAMSVLSTGAYTTVANFTTIFQQPATLSTPTLVSPANGATGVPTTATIVWSVNPVALQYEYQLATTSGFTVIIASGTTATTGATIANLQYNTVYYWRVRSKYNATVSAYSGARNFTSLAGPPPLQIYPPAFAINVPSTSCTLTWTDMSPNTGYQIQVSTVSTFSPTLTSQTISVTTFTLTGLEKNRQYFWRVRAFGTSMGTTPYTTANFVTEVPKYATKLTITNVTSNSLKSNVPFTVMIRTVTTTGTYANLTTASAFYLGENNAQLSILGATGSSLEIGQSVTTLTLVVNNTSSASIAGLFTATSSGSTTNSLSATSQTLTIFPVTTLSAVVLVAPTSSANAVSVSPALTWKVVEGASAYSVQVSTAANFSSLIFSTTASLASFTSATQSYSPQLSLSTHYFWRVNAVNNLTTGTWSNAWDFTTRGALLLLSPNGNEQVLKNSTRAILWSSVDNAISSVNIEVSIDGGASWMLKANAIPNSGNYIATFTEAGTTQALVRVSNAANSATNDQSDAGFTIISHLPLNVRALLEGAYASSGTMTTLLNVGGYLPLTDPYNNLLSINAIPAGVTDWVKLEFRAETNASVVVGSQAAFLRSDGQIVGMSGSTTSVLDVSNILPGNYWMVIYHRNHLPVMTAGAQTFGLNPPMQYDFTDRPDRVHSPMFAALKQLETGVFGMASGDVNQDGVINAIDRIFARNSSGQTGYISADVNLDAVMNSSDRTFVGNNRFRHSIVP